MDADNVGMSCDLADEDRVGSRLGAPQASDEEQIEPLKPPRQVREEAQRRSVAPVEIVDDERDGLRGCEIDCQPVQTVERGEGTISVGFGLEADALKHGARRLGGAVEQLRAVLRRDEERLVQLAHDPERELPLEVAAVGRQDARPAGASALAQFRDQPTLPDPSRTLNDKQL